MFTGIVEAVGRVDALQETAVPGQFQLSLQTDLAGEAKIGDSLAVNGCCLTVVGRADGTVRFDLLTETLRRTNLESLKPGRLVNLERPLSASGRFDGHIVQGHIDGTAEVLSTRATGAQHRLEVALPQRFARYLVAKGSVAVDGISLTVAELFAESFVVWIIPHTWAVTNLCERGPGEQVNLEFDLIAKYVERLVTSTGLPSSTH